jgi:geranylgeranyl reductase family protein
LKNIDVAIVGAGPAGAHAAWLLVRQGARVALFDPSHPREKPCGGGITGRALDLIAGAVNRRAIDCVTVRSARFLLDRGTLRTGDAPRTAAVVDLDDGALVVSSRKVFDQALLSAAVQAGATHLPLRVLDVSIEFDGVTLMTDSGTYRAAFIVGADGANSLVRRRVAGMFRRDQLSIATGYFADDATSNEIVLHLLTAPAGYFWSFPRPDHLGIGICAPAGAPETASSLRRIVAEWIQRSALAPGARLRAYSWPIPTLAADDLQRLALSGPRWWLLGDAAGLVDPITREGIYFALASARWAADAIAGADAGRRYAARVRDEAVPELARAATLKALFFQPWFTRQLMAALEVSAAIQRVMADLIAGRQSYATLKWRLLGTFELGLAWKSLIARNTRHVL